MKIAHISDIHWRGLTRHAEYTKAFNDLFSALRKINPDMIFLGGDYFHTKTSGISPEVIDRLAWMFKSFADIAHTFAILGNHDGNLANESREDSISPIINAINSPRIHLYKKSGVYNISPFVFPTNSEELAANLCVFSCFDKEGWERVAPTPGVLNIAAFHGSVGGTRMDNGWIMPDSKAEVMLSMFDGYDFVFLGDIHKRQFLAQRPDKSGTLKPWIGYPGSTIQQNFGEEQLKGFLVWDIKNRKDWDVEFVEVENSQPFITFAWNNDPETSLKALEARVALRDGARYTVTSPRPLTAFQQRQMVHELKVLRGAQEVLFSPDKNLKHDLISHEDVVVKKASLRTNPEILQRFYRTFLELNTKKYQLTEAQMEDGFKIIEGLLGHLDATESETTRDVYWSIKEFEFDNLFRYGENNRLNFDTLEGVVGVFGKNKIGKSSLVGALMYVLFNSSDRDGISKNGQIMNQNKKSCRAKIVITVDDIDYRIERSSQRVLAGKKSKKSSEEEYDGDKTETKLTFTRLNKDGTETSLNGTTREETDKAIRKLLGNSQDFLMTTVATQRGMESFIDEGSSSRKTILNRFLDLDVFEKLHAFTKEHILKLNNKLSSYAVGWEKTVLELSNSIPLKEKEAEELQSLISSQRDEMANLRFWFAKNDSSDAIEASNNLTRIQQKLQSLQRQLTTSEQEQATMNKKIDAVHAKLIEVSNEYNKIDYAKLKQDFQSMKEIEERLNAINADFREQEKSIALQERNVKKLTLVPCGDQFPECLYIKDAHQDRKTIDVNKKKLSELAVTLEKATADLRLYQEMQLSQKMSLRHGLEQQLKDLVKEKTSYEAQLSLMNKSHGDINKWLSGARQEEARLLQLAGAKDDIRVFEEKKKEQTELQNLLFANERRRSDLLVEIGRDKAKLEQLTENSYEVGLISAKIQVFETLLAAFHKNGIPAMILKTQLPMINAELSRLLAGLVDFNITFETEPGSNSMDVYIEDGHSRRILELGSGMEKMLASIAIRVALCNLSSLPKSNIIILDEGFNALDDDHVGKCLELIQALKNHFKTVMVISHMQRVKEASDVIIEITSTNHESRVEA